MIDIDDLVGRMTAEHPVLGWHPLVWLLDHLAYTLHPPGRGLRRCFEDPFGRRILVHLHTRHPLRGYLVQGITTQLRLNGDIP